MEPSIGHLIQECFHGAEKEVVPTAVATEEVLREQSFDAFCQDVLYRLEKGAVSGTRSIMLGNDGFTRSESPTGRHNSNHCPEVSSGSNPTHCPFSHIVRRTWRAKNVLHSVANLLLTFDWAGYLRCHTRLHRLLLTTSRFGRPSRISRPSTRRHFRRAAVHNCV